MDALPEHDEKKQTTRVMYVLYVRVCAMKTCAGRLMLDLGRVGLNGRNKGAQARIAMVS